MKKTESKLLTEMGIFFFIVVLCFGLLIIKEKSNTIKINKINKKLDEYIDTNYKEFKDEFIIKKIKYKKNLYYKKIVNKNNNDLNFVVSYKDSIISSTYKKDYLEGKSLFTTLEKQIQKKLNNLNKNNNYKNLRIVYDIKLNNCTENVKNKLINGDHDLSLYTILDNKVINLDESNLQSEIIRLHNYILSLKLNPKNYKLTFTDINNETKSINVEFNEEVLLNNINIGKLVIENNKEELNKYNIKVNYLN